MNYPVGIQAPWDCAIFQGAGEGQLVHADETMAGWWMLTGFVGALALL